MVKQRFRLILLLTAAAVGLVVVPASADTILGENDVQGQRLPSADDVVTQDLARTLPQQQSVLDYWSPQRMRAATPVELPIADATATDGILKEVPLSQEDLPELSGTPKAPVDTESVPTGQVPGKPAVTAPEAPTQNTPAQTTTRSAAASTWSSGGGITKNVGKVFLTLNGKDFLCSATVVNSGNRDTLITAGHCVYDEGQFASNWTFVPGYSNGSAPHGKWTARALKAPAGWTQNGDLKQDVGFAVLNQQNGKHIADVVGAQKIAFNARKGAPIYSFGYPHYSPYNGESLQFCSDTARPDRKNADSTGQAIDCDMTEGSSGGPWVTGMQASGMATVVSLNSFSYSDNLDVMIGPALGSEAKTAYDAAARS